MRWKCLACGLRVEIPVETPRVHCSCGYVQENGSRPGLGDVVAAGLHRVGITRERYVAAKAAVGLRRRCNCPKRQQQLNALGSKAAAVLAKVTEVLG